MYSVLSTSFAIGAFLIVAGFLGKFQIICSAKRVMHICCASPLIFLFIEYAYRHYLGWENEEERNQKERNDGDKRLTL